jgi:hypothetical protein
MAARQACSCSIIAQISSAHSPQIVLPSGPVATGHTHRRRCLLKEQRASDIPSSGMFLRSAANLRAQPSQMKHCGGPSTSNPTVETFSKQNEQLANGFACICHQRGRMSATATSNARKLN